jgi:hypothetical protein
MQTALDTATLEYDQCLSIAADVATAAANRWRKKKGGASKPKFL